MNIFKKNKFIKELQTEILAKDLRIKELTDLLAIRNTEFKVRGEQEDNEVSHLRDTVSHDRRVSDRLIDTLQMAVKNPINIVVNKNGDY